jgi:hypothetical protein
MSQTTAWQDIYISSQAFKSKWVNNKFANIQLIGVDASTGSHFLVQEYMGRGTKNRPPPVFNRSYIVTDFLSSTNASLSGNVMLTGTSNPLSTGNITCNNISLSGSSLTGSSNLNIGSNNSPPLGVYAATFFGTTNNILLTPDLYLAPDNGGNGFSVVPFGDLQSGLGNSSNRFSWIITPSLIASGSSIIVSSGASFGGKITGSAFQAPNSYIGNYNIVTGSSGVFSGIITSAGTNSAATALPSRSYNTTYTNSTNKNMFVAVAAAANNVGAGTYQLLCDTNSPPTRVLSDFSFPAATTASFTVSGIVMPGYNYYVKATNMNAPTTWTETTF